MACEKMIHWSLSHLKFLIEHEAHKDFMSSLLLDPRRGWNPLDRDNEAFFCGEDILRHFEDNPGMKRLFILYMVTRVLTAGETFFELAEWFKERIEFSRIFQGLSWQDALQGEWVSTPILLAARKTEIRFLICGYAPGASSQLNWPTWTKDLLDLRAVHTMEAALRASKPFAVGRPGMRPYLYFLSVDDRITGSSLGLPAALCLSMLGRRENPPQHLAATGGISGSGKILPAKHLEAKASHAASMGFSLVLVPEDPAAPGGSAPCEIQKVDNLYEACLFASLHRPGNAGRLSVFNAMVNEPEGFAAACSSAEPQWLRWMARQHHRPIDVTSIAATPLRSESLVDVLEKWVEAGDLDRAEPLAELVGVRGLRSMELTSPVSAFRWCILNMALKNHQGRVNESGMWEKRARAIMEKSPLADFEYAVDYYNHRFVGLCHNLYRFTPGLPDYLQLILSTLEKMYKSQMKFSFADVRAYKSLGELCGSIAQNFGFCGRDYVSDVEKFAVKAQKAFGEGRIPDLREDWRRQFNYLVYAYLDAEKWDEAEKSLLRYLEIDSLWDLPLKLEKLGPWEHAVLARFFADTSAGTRVADDYYKKASKQVQSLTAKRHPWQLWLNNMARMAAYRGDLDSAAAWHRQSLDLCICDSAGATIKMMAMLSLAGLYEIGRLGTGDMNKGKSPIDQALDIVDPDHFAGLTNCEYEAMPAMVAAAPDRYFPFSYR